MLSPHQEILYLYKQHKEDRLFIYKGVDNTLLTLLETSDITPDAEIILTSGTPLVPLPPRATYDELSDGIAHKAGIYRGIQEYYLKRQHMYTHKNTKEQYLVSTGTMGKYIIVRPRTSGGTMTFVSPTKKVSFSLTAENWWQLYSFSLYPQTGDSGSQYDLPGWYAIQLENIDANVKLVMYAVPYSVNVVIKLIAGGVGNMFIVDRFDFIAYGVYY